MDRKPCTVCGAGATLSAMHPHALLYRCGDCDHCFSDLATMATSEPYDDAYFEATHRNWFENPHLWLFEQIHKRICSLGPAPSVLDIGCGRGDFLRWLRVREPQWKLTGIDLSPNEPMEGIQFVQGDILEVPLHGTFDSVVNLAVIEHVTDIHQFTQSLKRHCNPGGLVIIMTINDRSVLYDIGRLARTAGWATPFIRLYDRHHLNHFNERSLRRLVEINGLDVCETVRHNIPMNAVDMPTAGMPIQTAWRAGVWGTFMLGRLLRRTFLQTLICRPG